MPRKLVFKNVAAKKGSDWHTKDFPKVNLTRVSWDNRPDHALAYVFFGHVNIDFDGSPTAYGPAKMTTDDNLGNAGNKRDGWFGVAARVPTDPLVQNEKNKNGIVKIDDRAPEFQGKFPVVQQVKNGDPKPGFYVSTTSRHLISGTRAFPDYLQNNYVDSSKVAFGALDDTLKPLGVKIGDYGIAIRHNKNLESAFYFLDGAGAKHALGECSHKVGKDLGGSGRGNQFDNNFPVSFIIFPGHGYGDADSVVAWRDRSDSVIKRGIYPRLLELSQASNAKELVLLMGFNEAEPPKVPQGIEKLEQRLRTGHTWPENYTNILLSLSEYGFLPFPQKKVSGFF